MAGGDWKWNSVVDSTRCGRRNFGSRVPKRRRHAGWQLERLEDRLVLDCALPPAIFGTIYDDRNGSGDVSADEPLVGVGVQLILDDGDGLYLSDVDTLVATVQTDMAGEYCFAELDADAGYFIVRPAQVVSGATLETVISPRIRPGRPGVVIDEFQTRQTAQALPPAPSSKGSVLQFPDDAEVIGRERDMFTELISGVGDVVLVVNPFGLEELLEFNNSPGTLGGGVVTWDGIDGDSEGLAFGLNGRDLAELGRNTGIVLRGGVDVSGAGTRVLLRLYRADAETFSQAEVELPVTGGDASGYLYVPFASFQGPVSPTRVDAIQLAISNASQATDGKIALLGAIGPKRFDIAEQTVADLSVTKTNGVDVLAAGDVTTYAIQVTNQGPMAVSGAQISDLVSASFQDVRYTSQAFGGAVGNTPQGTGDLAETVNLPPGSSIVYTVQATLRAEAQGPVENRVDVIPPRGVIDPDVTNNSAIDRDLLGTRVDLSISKDDNQREVRVGEQVTYRIVARNLGPVAVQGARVTDVFPATLQNVSFVSTASAGVVGNTPAGSGDLNETVDLPVGGVVSYVVTATVGAEAVGTLVNRARIGAPPGMVDPITDNNEDVDVDLVQRELTDVSITKTDGLTSVSPGQSLTYSIVVSNAGPSNAAGVNVVDAFPASLIDVSYTSQAIGGASGGSPSGTGRLDDLVNLPAGSSIVYTVRATVAPSASGELENTATVTAPATDVNPANNSATDVTLVGEQADLVVTKSDGVTTVRPGEPLTYTVVVSNLGPSDVTGARVLDSFSTNLIDVTYQRTGNGTTETGDGAIDEEVDLPAGASLTYTIQGTVDPAGTGSVSNTATVQAPLGVIDPRPGNNTATDVDQILRSRVDVAIRKLSDRTTAVPGGELSYTILVSNVGEEPVTSARVVDDFPASLTEIQSTSRALGGATGNTPLATGNLDETLMLPPGASVIYTVRARVNPSATGVLQNFVSVELTDQLDTNPSNNLDLNVVALVPHAELSITKTDGLNEVEVGQQLTYEVRVQNAGPSDASDVRITDLVPPGLQNVVYLSSFEGQVSGHTPQGTGDIQDLVDLAAGSSITYQITADVAADVSGVLTNVATVQGPIESGFVELDPSNNRATDQDRIASLIVLGSEPTVIRSDEITDAGLTDRFQIVGHATGKMIITAHFDHQRGDLQLAVDDRYGNPIATVDSKDNDEQLVIPVVSQERYFVRLAGASGEETNSYDLEIENFAAPIPQVVRLAPATDTGMRDDDAVTAQSRPTLIVQADLADLIAIGIPILEPDGEALPAGPGAAVEVTLTHAQTGETLVGYATAIGPAGQLFSFTPAQEDELSSGDYVVTSAVRIFDGATVEGVPAPATARSQRSDPFWMTVDRVAPSSADRPDLLDSSDSGMSFRDNVTNQTQPALRGVGEPNIKVRILTNRIGGQGEVVGQGVTNADGSWEITVEPLSDDSYHFRVEYEDLAGNVSSIGEPLVVEVDTLAPNTPYLDLLRTSDRGVSDSDDVTSATDLTFSMTTQDPRQAQHELKFNYRYRLFVRPDASGELVSGEERLIYDSAIDADLPVASLLDGLTNLEQLVRTRGPFPDGVHNFKLEVEDRAGNLSPDYLLTVRIDTSPPPVDFALAPSSDTGAFGDDGVTMIREPAFTGMSEVGATVSLFANGQLAGRSQVGSDDSGGSSDDGLGVWEITTQPLADGRYDFTVRIEDAAGNLATSQSVSVWIDAQSPNVPLLDLISDSGISHVDNVTRDNTPAVTVTAAATRDGGANPFPHEIKYRIYDRPGDGNGEVLLIDSFGALRELASEGFFTETLPELSDGVHNLKVEVEDRAGNISQAFLLNVVIDTQTPDLAGFRLSPSSDTGMDDQDGVTAIHQPAFSGSGTVGDRVRLYANGQLVGDTRIDSDPVGNPLDPASGRWEVISQPLEDGQYEFQVQVEDLAGNVNVSSPITIWIDRQRPNLPLLDLISDTGLSDTDNITKASPLELTLTGNDTLDGGPNPFPNDLKYRVYGRTGGADEVLLYDSFANLGSFTQEGLLPWTLPGVMDGIHNFKLEVEDRAGNVSLPFLLDVQVDLATPIAVDLDLARYSDSGASDTDRVTNIRQPAVFGTGSMGEIVLVYANGQLVGRGHVNGDISDTVLEDNLGAWEVTLEPLDDGVYNLVALIEDVAGNAATTPTITVEIDTLAPNTPALDLLELDDTGRHNDDNLTRAESFSFTATTSDPNAAQHLELVPDGQNFNYRLYARPEEGPEVLVYDSGVDAGIPDLLDGLTSQTLVVTTPLNLPEGLHQMKLEVEDRAGNLSPDYFLEVLVDRTPFAGQAMLHPVSGGGTPDTPGGSIAGVTRAGTPTFTGTAEANALVSVAIDGIPAGTTVAIPWDGDDALQPPEPPYELQGNWTLLSTIALADGDHSAVFTFEDPAGNRATRELTLTIDTTGPRIVNLTRNEAGFPSLFDPKPASGPDPLIDSIVIHLSNGPQGSSGRARGLDLDIAGEEGNYVLVGDANGHIPMTRVEVQSSDDPANATSQIILHFARPLPDDRFTLTVSDQLSDPMGNRLDGESGARAPFEGAPGPTAVAPIFPTGDGVAGGDFVARFTVDSRPELGIWGGGSVWADLNGNFQFDPENLDFVNRDLVFRYGFTSDDLFAGNFALPGQMTDGYDKLAAYGRAEGEFRWLVDTDNDGVPNIDRVEPQAVNGLPVAGEFDGNLANGDEVALFDGKFWYLDTDHNFQTDAKFPSRLVGYPVVGDFDGDGFDDLATWADDRYMIDLANGALRGWDGFADTVFTFGFIGVRERPVAADLNQDGFDDLGLWVPDREGATDRDRSEWYFLLSEGQTLLERLSPPDDPIDSRPTIDFRPHPFGPDRFARFGDEFALPIVGNFDPPSFQLEVPISDFGWTNPVDMLDVTADEQVSPLDALLIINDLNEFGARALATRTDGAPYLDVNGDGFLSPLDALLVLNELNRINFVRAGLPAATPVRPESSAVASALLADQALAALEIGVGGARQAARWSQPQDVAEFEPTKQAAWFSTVWDDEDWDPGLDRYLLELPSPPTERWEQSEATGEQTSGLPEFIDPA